MKHSKLFICNKLLVFRRCWPPDSLPRARMTSRRRPTTTNRPRSFSPSRAVAVPKSDPSTLTVTATDPDGDAVSVLWEVTTGHVLTRAQQGNPSITWRAPLTTGRDTITITASDGKGGTTTLVETILVGTLKTSGFPRPTWTSSECPVHHPAGPEQAGSSSTPMATLTMDAGLRAAHRRRGPRDLSRGDLRANGTADKPGRDSAQHSTAGSWLLAGNYRRIPTRAFPGYC